MCSMLRTLAIALVSWTTIYYAFQYQLSPECATRAVSFVHSLFAAVLSGQLYMKCDFPGLGMGTTNSQRIVLLGSIGYFLYDTAIGIKLGILENHFLLHHIVAATSLAYSVIRNVSGWEIIACLFFTEASNPFYHLHWFFQLFDQTNGALYSLNLITFLSTFIAFRIFLASAIIFSALHSRNVANFIKFTGFSLLVMNAGFTTVLGWQFFCYLDGRKFIVG